MIAEVFAPTADELDWARAVVVRGRRAEVSATLESGEMVDPAMLGRAQGILGDR